MSKKPGKQSGIKPGEERTFVLKKPICVGHPVVEKIISSRSRTQGVVLGFQKTSTVLTISESKNGFRVETETSFYEVNFHKK